MAVGVRLSGGFGKDFEDDTDKIQCLLKEVPEVNSKPVGDASVSFPRDIFREHMFNSISYAAIVQRFRCIVVNNKLDGTN